MQLGVVATVGFADSAYVSDWAAMLFGLRSYWYAGSFAWTGNTPVVWSRGRSFVVIVRVPLAIAIVKLESHLTLPETATFLLTSYSVSLLTNHGPLACAP